MSHVNIKDMWATDGTAPHYYRTVMSYNCFQLLLRALKFDGPASRAELQLQLTK